MGLASGRHRFDLGLHRLGHRLALFAARLSPLTETALWLSLFALLAIAVAVRWAPLMAADKALLRWVNQGWATGWLDKLMAFFSGMGKMPLVWLALLGWLLIFAVRKSGWRKGWTNWLKTVLMLAIAIGCADGLSSHVAKGLVHRERPPYLVKGVRLPEGVGSSLGFPSSHAANAFAAARVLSALAPPRWLWWLLAIAIALSRVYLGVHFPADSVGGALLGLAVGALVIWMRQRLATSD
ncbi:MAG: hypothetical protein YPKNTGVA_000354 [Candidatus Fervidibacter sp.]|jgi:undecaprenyl-diphosphatase